MEQKHKETERITIRFNEEQTLELNYLMDKFNLKNKSNFIKKCIFQKQITYVAKDENLYNIYEKLSRIIAEYNKVAVNYNQVVKRLHTDFGKEMTRKLLSGLHEDTISLLGLTREVMPIVKLLEEKYDCKNQ